MQGLVNQVQAQGRGGDTMLVHMTPREVGGLQALAQAKGGSLTVNPQTGLPEAGFLDDILPILGGLAGGALGLDPWMAGVGAGAVQGLITGDLEKGLMAGLGAYGGASVGAAANPFGMAGDLKMPSAAAQTQAANTAALSKIDTPAGGMGSPDPVVSGMEGGWTPQATAPVQGLAAAAPQPPLADGFWERLGPAAGKGLGDGFQSIAPYAAGFALLAPFLMQNQGGTSLPKDTDKSTPYAGPYTPQSRTPLNPQIAKGDSSEKLYFKDSNPYPGFTSAEETRKMLGYASGGSTRDSSERTYNFGQPAYVPPAAPVSESPTSPASMASAENYWASKGGDAGVLKSILGAYAPGNNPSGLMAAPDYGNRDEVLAQMYAAYPEMFAPTPQQQPSAPQINTDPYSIPPAQPYRPNAPSAGDSLTPGASISGADVGNGFGALPPGYDGYMSAPAMYANYGGKTGSDFLSALSSIAPQIGGNIGGERGELSTGNYLNAAMGALGMIPGVGMIPSIINFVRGFGEQAAGIQPSTAPEGSNFIERMAFGEGPIQHAGGWLARQFGLGDTTKSAPSGEKSFFNDIIDSVGKVGSGDRATGPATYQPGAFAPQGNLDFGASPYSYADHGGNGFMPSVWQLQQQVQDQNRQYGGYDIAAAAAANLANNAWDTDWWKRMGAGGQGVEIGNPGGGGPGSSIDTNAKGGVHLQDGAFIVDARTVSELGNGSSNAGLEMLAKLGGKPINGPGDGVSDDIPAMLDGNEARVARDEVQFDPEAVAALGGGDHKKGTALLYDIMKKAHKARKKADRGEDTGLRALLGANNG